MGVKCFERECGTTRSQMGTSCCGVPGLKAKWRVGRGIITVCEMSSMGFFFNVEFFI